MTTNNKFEESFANLAYSALNEKDSSLVDYVIGFQLIEHNDEGTRALGFFALKVGESHYYVPVFFIGGKLKPLELLYSKSEDKFMPLTTQWVDYLGKDAMRELGQVMKRPQFKFSNPDLTPFKEPPTTGRLVYASSKSGLDWYDIKKMTVLPVPARRGKLDLIIKQASKDMKLALKKMFQETPELLKKACQYTPWEDIKEAFDTTKVLDLEKEASDKFREKIKRVYILDKQALASSERQGRLDDSVKKALTRDGLASIDHRVVTSEVHRAQKPKQYETVSNPGVYKVIDSMGKVRVVYATNAFIKFKKEEKHAPMLIYDKINVLIDPSDTLVIDLSSGGVFKVLNTHLVGEPHKDAPSKIAKMLSAAKHYTQVESGKHYVFCFKRGAELICSSPFKVERKMLDDGGIIRFGVKGIFEYGPDYTLNMSTRIGPSISILENMMTLTDDIKFFPVSIEAMHSDPLVVGNKANLTAALLDENLNAVNVSSDGVEATVRTAFKQVNNLSKKACAQFIAEDLGISGEQAIELTMEAFDKGKSDFFVKVAYQIIPKLIPREYAGMPYADDPRAFFEPTLEADVQTANYDELPQTRVAGYGAGQKGYFKDTAEVGDNLQANLSDPQAVPFPGEQGGSEMGLGMPGVPQGKSPIELERELAMQAMQAGAPEVFDAGVLGTMSGVHEANRLVMSFIPELEKALDRIGRMIFLFWWKYDDFSDQYGVNDMYETEDKLRNLFKAFGDIIIKFKRKGTAAASIENVE